MKYLVDITDTSYATVSVEANSLEEAEKVAQDAYFDGKIEWRDCDLNIEARPLEREAER